MRPTRIKKGKKFYRMRKGTLVEIPEIWVGIVTHPQTIRKRQSKQIGKVRRIMQCQKRELII